MRLLKLILVLALQFPIHVWAAEDEALPYYNLVIQSLNKCYANHNSMSSDLAACVSNKIINTPNPDNYKAAVYMDSDSKSIPGIINLRIYNKHGHQLHCVGRTLDSIIIDSCVTKDGSSLSKRQLISIDPPPI